MAAAGLTEPRCADERGLAMGGGRPTERRFTVGGSGKSVARCHRMVLAYWKFESISLQRRVRCEPVSRENSSPYVEKPRFPAGVRAGASGAVERDSQGPATSRRGAVVSLSGDIPVPYSDPAARTGCEVGAKVREILFG